MSAEWALFWIVAEYAYSLSLATILFKHCWRGADTPVRQGAAHSHLYNKT